MPHHTGFFLLFLFPSVDKQPSREVPWAEQRPEEQRAWQPDRPTERLHDLALFWVPEFGFVSIFGVTREAENLRHATSQDT